MSRIWDHIPDIIALIIVVGCIVLIARGIDGEVKAILGAASGFVFGRYASNIGSKLSGKTTT